MCIHAFYVCVYGNGCVWEYLFMWYKCVNVYALGTHATVHTWWPEDNFGKSVLFFHLYMHLNDGTQATRLGSQAPLAAEPSHREQQQSFMSSYVQ